MITLVAVGLTFIVIGGQAAATPGVLLLLAGIVYGLRRSKPRQTVFEPRLLWPQAGMLPGRETTWGRGARGEQLTAHELARLEPFGFLALHDRRARGSLANIDHVVVGPTGLFIVETKRYTAGVQVRDEDLYIGPYRHVDFIEQAHREADTVASIVGSHVEPVVCIHPARFRTPGPHRVRGCWVVSLMELGPLLLNGPPVLSAGEVWALADTIDRGLELAEEGQGHA